MKFNLPRQILSVLLLSFALLLAACGGGSGTTGATPAGTFTYTVGGKATGITGTVVLQNADDDTVTLTSSGDFSFPKPVTSGNSYNVTVLSKPAGQSCTVKAGAGTVGSSNVSDVEVACSKDSYTIGGAVTGLSGTVALQDNNGDNLIIAADGTFAFATKIDYGTPYNVTIAIQPTGQTCSVSSGSGIVSTNNVSNVAVFCSSNAYTIGGTITGLTGTVALQVNNGDNLAVVANGAFTFTNKVAYSSPYNVSVLSHPAGQICSVASGAGTMGNANITNVAITCANAYSVGGTVSQLNGSLVLQNNAADNLTVSANGLFTFPTAVPFGNTYNVSVLNQPTNQKCLVKNGAGNVTSNVNNVSLSCTTLMGGAMQGIALNLAPTVSTLNVATTFSDPFGITTDGTNLYVVDSGHMMIRKIVIATGEVSTLAGTGAFGAADGPGATATFFWPFDITTDGTNLYVTDNGNHKIRKIVIATGVVSSLTGVANTAGSPGAADGAGATATFNRPQGITTDGTNLYVADELNNKIRKIVIATGFVSSLTGSTNSVGVADSSDGVGETARFSIPYGITTDGTNLYVADVGNKKIRKIVIATGVVSSFTGTANTAAEFGSADGAGTTATFGFLYGITTDGTNLYVADAANNHKIRKIVIATGVVSSLTGVANTAGTGGSTDGAGAAARFNYPTGITSDGTNLYVVDRVNNKIRKIQ